MPIVYKMLTFSNRYKHKQIADKIVCLHCREYLFLECQCDGIDVRLAYQYQATTSPCIVLYAVSTGPGLDTLTHTLPLTRYATDLGR